MILFFRKLVIHKTNNTTVQFFRSILVGGLSFLVDFKILWMCTDRFYIYYLISAVIAFVFGLVTAYLLSVYWVFKERLLNDQLHEFIFFTVLGIIALLLNEILLWLFTDIFQIYYLVSKVLLTI